MSQVFDYESSLHRMGDDKELFQEMIGLLESDAPSLLDTLQRARQAGDHANVQRAAHTLKGLAANFGAERAVGAAADVERLAKAHQESGMDVAVQKLGGALTELISALASERSGGRVVLGK